LKDAVVENITYNEHMRRNDRQYRGDNIENASNYVIKYAQVNVFTLRILIH
jgi:hypothetical protein